jgi:dihydropteroate synthase
MTHPIRVMGILNATPDSFSDGGQYNEVDSARARAMQMIAEGADILDIGGESTRPGASVVDAATELQRVLPIIEALAPTCPVPISIDTYKADVAEAAVRAGASIINDVWGGLKDPRIREVAAATDAIYIITHNRLEAGLKCSVQDVCQETLQLVDLAKQAGVRAERIWIDPGFGFAKTYDENLRLMRGLDQFCQLGYPVVLGTSRKTFIRKTLSREAHEVLEGSLATAVLGAQQGCAVIRVHDVAETRRALTMTEAIMKANEE